MTDIADIVSRLRGTENVNDVYATIDGWSKAGLHGELASLWQAVEDGADGSWPYEAVADHVEEVLAASNAVEPLVGLLGRERRKSVQHASTPRARISVAASRLGHARNVTALVRALGMPGTRELAASWMHELVLRGEDLTGVTELQAFHAALAAEKHPLGTMPLKLLPLEREAPSYMPLYGDRALAEAVASLESTPISARTIPPPAEHAAPTVSLVPDRSVSNRLRASFAPWLEGSNGKVEAEAFLLTPHVPPVHGGRWLVSALPLAAMKDAVNPAIERAESAAVWGSLLAAGANGGAYTWGLGGAYGRRAAWTSFGALCGAPESASPEAIAALAGGCTFLTFRSEGPWFYEVAWDLGVLALRPDGASVAVIAATDTD